MTLTQISAPRESILPPAEPIASQHSHINFAFFCVHRLILDFSGHVLVLSGQKKLLSMTRRPSPTLPPFCISKHFPCSLSSIPFVFKSGSYTSCSFRFRWEVRRKSLDGGGGGGRYGCIPPGQITACHVEQHDVRRALTPYCRRNHTTAANRTLKGVHDGRVRRHTTRVQTWPAGGILK